MKKLTISPVDALFANGGYPIQFLLYYAQGVKTDTLRAALRELSAPFWPLFGEYRPGQIVFEGYREDASFSVEASDREFDAGEPNPAIHERYRHVIPRDTEKLFFLKVVQYPNGTALLAKLNHVAGDGYSFFYFLATLAEKTRNRSGMVADAQGPALPEPHHRRTLFRNLELGDLAVEPLAETGGATPVFLEVPRAAVREKIRRIAAHQGQRVSTNDILAAMAVKRLAAAEAGQTGDDFLLTVPIDVRRAIPELGPGYLGNGLMFGHIPFSRAGIRAASLPAIAVAIRKGMPEVSGETYALYLEELATLVRSRQPSRLRTYDPQAGCLVTNLSRLPEGQLDFGSGTPDHVLPLTVGRNSAAVLAGGDQFVLRLEY